MKRSAWTAWRAGLVAAILAAGTAVAVPVVEVDDDFDAATPGWGTTHFASLQNGIDAADPGGTVNVAAGAYTGHMTIGKDLTLLGAQAGVPADGRTGNESLIQGTFNIGAGSPNVTIDGFSFQAHGASPNAFGLGSPYNTAIFGTATQALIRNNIFAHATDGTSNTYPGLLWITCTTLVVTDNVIDQNLDLDTNAAYLTVLAGGTATISGNTVTGALGLGANAGAALAITGNTIVDSRVEGIWFWPVDATAALTITGNTVLDYNDLGQTGTAAIKLTARPASVNGETVTLDMLAALQSDNTGMQVAKLDWIKDVHNVTQDTFFDTIQAAIDAANAGDAIHVAAGTYPENPLVNKPLTLQGANAGVVGSGARGPESTIDGGSGSALRIAADSVTVDGFELASLTGVAVSNQVDFSIVNNVIGADLVGIAIGPVQTTSDQAFTVASNLVAMTSQDWAGTPTIGIALNGISGTNAPALLDNEVSGPMYGWLLSALNTSAGAPVIEGGSVTGVMQGVAVLNMDPLSYAPVATHFAVDGTHMSGFTGTNANPAINFHAGVYVFTGGSDTNAVVHGAVRNVTVTGTGKPQQDSAGLAFADFSTEVGVRQQIELENCTIENNANRGIQVRGQNALVAVTRCTVTGNGFDPFGAGGNDGFGVIVRQGAQVTVTESVMANPASVAGGYSATVLASHVGAGVTASNNSLSNNGCPTGRLAVEDGTGALDASGNWWGGTDDAALAALMGGGADFTPYLGSGADTDAGTTGFQGDFTTLHVTSLGGQTAGGRIQEGVDVVSGSTVYVEAGTYNEGVDVDTFCELRASDGPAVTIIDGTGTARPASLNLDCAVNIALPDAGGHTLLNGFTITGSGAPSNVVGVIVNGRADLLGLAGPQGTNSSFEVSNCVFENLPDASAALVCTHANLAANTSGLIVSNEVAQSGIGVMILNSHDCRVAHNHIHDNTDLGVFVAKSARLQALGAAPVACERIVVEHNTIADNGGLSPTLQAYGAFFGQEPQYPVAGPHGRGNVFRHNTVSGNDYPGLFVLAQDAAAPLRIVGNTFEGNGAFGGAQAGGLLIADSPSTVVVSNDVLANLAAGMAVSGAASGITMERNNIIGNAAAGLANNSGDALVAENNWWGSYAGPGLTDGGGRTGDTVVGTVDSDPWTYGRFRVNSDGEGADDDGDPNDDNDPYTDVLEVALGTDPLTDSTPSVVWVNPAWSTNAPGDTVDGHRFAYDAFDILQDAADIVASGGTINVAAASYGAGMTIDRDVSISGDPFNVSGSLTVGDGASVSFDTDVTCDLLEIAADATVHADGVDVNCLTDLHVQAGGSLAVTGGSLTVAGATVSGSFTIEDSWGTLTITDDFTIDGGTNTWLYTHVVVSNESKNVAIRCINGADVTIDHCLIEAASGSSNYLFTVENGTTFTLTDSMVYHCGASGVADEAGLFVDTASPVIFGNTFGINRIGLVLGPNSSGVTAFNNFFYLNEAYAVYNHGPQADLRQNAWFHVSGPSHPTLNYYGRGGAIEGDLVFAPWLAVALDTDPTVGFDPGPSPVLHYLPERLVFTTQPVGDTLFGTLLMQQPVVEVHDINGTRTPWAQPDVDIALGQNPTGGTLSGTTTQPAVGGVAVYDDLVVDTIGGIGFSLTATAPALLVAESFLFDVRNPVPVLSRLSPFWRYSRTAGFTLTVSGEDFVPGATVLWDGSPRATTFVDANTVRAAITSDDLARSRTAIVTVRNPEPTDGPSNGLEFAITLDLLVPNDVTTDTTWRRETVYVLDRPIFVKNGATLTVEAGTVIRAENEPQTAGDGPGALIVTRGAKIRVMGTCDRPVIMTDLDDDHYAGINPQPGTAPYSEPNNGLTRRWGGLILLGNAVLSGTNETVFSGLEAHGALGLYGGSDDGDSSGELHYLSIRYAGQSLLPDGDDLAGLTLAGIGRGTAMDHVEVIQSAGDGFAWLGGAANARYLVSWSAGRDSFACSAGYRGKQQFCLGVQGAMADAELRGDNAMQFDSPAAAWISAPTIFNATLVGLGLASGDGANTALDFRGATGGRLHNSILCDFGGEVALIEGALGGTYDAADNTQLEYNPSNYDVYFGAGHDHLPETWRLEIAESVMWNMGADTASYTGGGEYPLFNHPTHWNAAIDVSPLRALVRAASAVTVDGVSVRPVASLDPLITTAYSRAAWLTYGRTAPVDGFFAPVAFPGAFADRNWAAPWTLAYRLGMLTGSETCVDDYDGIVPMVWQDDTDKVFIALVSDMYAGHAADWWIVLLTPQGDLMYLDLSGAQPLWVPGLQPTFSGPLFDVAPFEVLDPAMLPPAATGNYTVFFGVDLDADGVLDFDELYLDSVPVN